MAVKLYLDTRRPLKDGTCPVKISVSANGRQFILSSGVCIRPENYSEGAVVTNREPQSAMKRAMIRSMIARAEEAVMAMQSDGSLKRLSLQEMRKRMKEEILGVDTEMKEKTFIGYLLEFSETKRSEGTKGVYRQTARKLAEFDPVCTFDSMDIRWLSAFDRWMAAKGVGTNTRGWHMRNIRAVFNYAIDEEMTTAYPFRKFKIAKQETPKRSLSVEQLRTLFAFEVEPHQAVYRDMFALTFYLIGINPVDLYALTDIKDGRIEYHRAKTGKLYSIRIEPEAQAIIDKYKGAELLLNIGERTQYKNFIHRQNIELKRIGEIERTGRGGKKVFAPLFPELSIYWARHTWATIAAECDVPDDVISQALGHSTTNATTAIYIKRSLAKIDEANRKVIDYVNRYSPM